MARVVVAGISECTRFAHVDHFAEYLAGRLPDFQYHRIVVSRYNWPAYVLELNRKNDWNITHSPIVWKEPGVTGGKAYLVGGASDFWEYVQQYYGFLSNITKTEGELLAQDAFQKFLDEEREAEQRAQRQHHRRVTVSGAGHPMTSLLVRELLDIPELQMELGVIVTLFDRNADEAELREIALDGRGVGASAGLGAVRAAESVADAFGKCDLLIVLDRCKRVGDESLISWLARNHEQMVNLASDLNRHAPDTCRVVYAAPDAPACFNATVLADCVIDIDKANVVTVTADLGLEALFTLSNACDVPLSDMHCPPVWGFVGLNKLVDLRATRYATELVMPNKRAIKARPETTLPTSTTKKVVYPIGPELGSAVGLWLAVARDKARSLNELYFAKVKATCDMLGFWFREPVPTLRGRRMRRMTRLRNVTAQTYTDKAAAALPKGPVISLGIVSNGAFKIPEGLNFSQQVCLRNGRWVPFKRFPEPKDQYVKMKDLCASPCSYLKELNVGGTLNADYLLNPEELADKKKANFRKEYGSRIRKIQMDKKIRMAAKARERALNIRFKRRARLLDKESEAMIRDNVVATLVRELVKDVLDICEPYPDKVEVVFKQKNYKDEIGGEGGEGGEELLLPEEQEEDDDEYGDEDEDELDDD